MRNEKKFFRGAFRQCGVGLVELMVGITVGLFIVAGLAVIFANSSFSYGEMQKQSVQIENGRYAFDMLRDDLQHAGFYGAATTLPTMPGSLDPCDVTVATLSTGIAVPIQGYDSPATSPITSCLPVANHLANTDILVIRRADPSALGSAALPVPPVTGQVYVQANSTNLAVQAGNASGFLLPSLNSDNSVNAVGTTAGGAVPSIKKMMNVAGASPFVTSARVAADIRPLHVHIYFVSPCSRPAAGQANCTAAADGGNPIPTLKRLELSASGGSAVLQTRTIAEGIENLQVEYGFDTTPTTTNLATGFPGDGVIDTYATTVPGGSFAQWANVMSARIYVLARNPLATPGFVDDKTYAMGLAGTYTPTSTAYRRHLFAGEIRVVNLSARREEPI